MIDAPSALLTKKEITLNESWSFPLEYAIELDTSEVLIDNRKTFSISAKFMKDGKLSFISDTLYELVDFDTRELITSIDINIVPV